MRPFFVYEKQAEGDDTQPSAPADSRPRTASRLVVDETDRSEDASSPPIAGGKVMLGVLVIDDDPDLRGTLRDMLEELGCRVLEAKDGADGVARFDAPAVDLVFTDILMPRQEGLETIRELRKLKPGLSIVAMSGGGPMQDMRYLDFAGKLGADHVLEKPFDFRTIAQIIGNFAARIGDRPA